MPTPRRHLDLCRIGLRGFAAVLGSLLLVSAAVAIDDPVERTVVTTLSNGLRVLTLEDHTTPVVSFQMWVGVGSRDEGQLTGLAHLFEHMMFKGSTHIAPEEHSRLIQARGGRVNAFTSRDFTVYFADIPRESLPLVIDLEAERIAYLDISLETLESEREVVLEERRMRTDDSPNGLAFENLLALAFQAHPYRRPVIGWRSDIAATTVAAAQEFFQRYYVPNNIILSLAGDFDTAEALDRIRRSFGGLSRSAEIVRSPTVEPEQRGERRGIVHFDVRSPLLAAAWHAPKSGHADSEALDVASQILSGGRSSRLYRKLVYESEQALFAQGGYWEMLDGGLFYAFAGVRPDGRIERVEEDFFAVIAQLRRELVTERELEKAKRQLEVGLVNGLATNHALASRVAMETAVFGRVRPLSERLKVIRAVTAEDVRRVVATYLTDSRRSVIHVVRSPDGGGDQ